MGIPEVDLHKSVTMEFLNLSEAGCYVPLVQ